MAEILKRTDDENEAGDVQFDSLPDLEISHPEEQRICPACEKGTLHYDYFLNLYCDQCGYVEASCFT